MDAEELLMWLERTSTGWRELLAKHVEALALPCDIRETETVAGLVLHIVAVELRYAERLHDLPITPYEDISSDSTVTLYAAHDRAMTLLWKLLPRDEVWWAEWIEMTTRKTGTMRAPRRVVLFHAAMHSIRHYAQLATLVRRQGIAPAWSMDYLFMVAKLD